MSAFPVNIHYFNTTICKCQHFFKSFFKSFSKNKKNTDFKPKNRHQNSAFLNLYKQFSINNTIVLHFYLIL